MYFLLRLEHSCCPLIRRGPVPQIKIHPCPCLKMSCRALPEEVWKRIMQHVPVAERLRVCSTVSTLLYRAAAAATQEVCLPYSRPQGLQSLSGWLMQHGGHITRLQLDSWDPDFVWRQLPCQQLQELVVTHVSLQLAPSSSQPGLLQCCTGLIKLYLHYVNVSDGAVGLAALTSLPRLQDLELHADLDTDLLIPETVFGVLTGLTRVSTAGFFDTKSFRHLGSLCVLQELKIATFSVDLVPEEIPGVTQLTSLHTFWFYGGGTLDPALLQSCTNMQRLTLVGVTIRAGDNPNALLELLRRLQGLQHLQLREVAYDWPPACAAYGALAGGSKLQHLELRDCSLPAGAWQFVFPVEGHRPQLTSLSLRGLPQAATFSTGDASSLAGCCPALQTLVVELQPDVLLPNNLSSLSSLAVLNVSKVSPGALLSSLVTLQGLENLVELDAVFEEPLPPEHLLRLTCLRQLRVLDLTYGAVGDDDGLCYVHEDRTAAPDVWLQVLEDCAKSPECQPVVIRSLSQVLAKEQQQRLETEARHQQQLDAASAEAAELRGRLAVLEGQVQQLLACLP